MDNSAISYVDKVFEKEAFPTRGTQKTHFDDCTFINCDMHESHLSNCHFESCQFKNCNLTMAHVQQSIFDNTRFENCKLTGIDFSKASDFLFSIICVNCAMDYVAFVGKKNKNAYFDTCSFKSADFSSADFTAAVFANCNFERAVFEETILKNADFSTAYNFHINPQINQLSKAKFSLDGLPGLLSHHDIIIK